MDFKVKILGYKEFTLNVQVAVNDHAIVVNSGQGTFDIGYAEVEEKEKTCKIGDNIIIVSAPGKVVYKLCRSGAYLFLLNTATGFTWGNFIHHGISYKITDKEIHKIVFHEGARPVIRWEKQ